MNNIKTLRLDKGIKQAELAAFLNIAQGTLSYWENGTYDIDNKSLIKLSDYFGTSTDYVLGKTDDKHTPLIEGVEFAFFEGYRQLDNEDRAELNRMAERMLELKQLKSRVE